MMKIEVIAHTDEDLELLKPLLDPARSMLAHPRHWETRVLFEELQRRAATVGKQVHLVEISGEGHTSTQVGDPPAHTQTDPGGQAETTRQAEQNPAPPPAGNGAARNKGFTAEAKRLWEQYLQFHHEPAESVPGTSKTDKVTKADMERWLEAHPEVVRAFAEKHAPPQTGDQTTSGELPPEGEAPAADGPPDQDSVIAWANVLMQSKGFDGVKTMFTDMGSTNGKLSGISQERWSELVAKIQDVTGVTVLPT